jgi:hypothetical protein
LIHYFCTLIWSFIDSYYVSLGYLYKLQKEKKRDLIENIQFFAETLYFERVIDHYECTSRETIKHSIKLFKALKVIHCDENRICTLACSIVTLNDLEFVHKTDYHLAPSTFPETFVCQVHQLIAEYYAERSWHVVQTQIVKYYYGMNISVKNPKSLVA